MIGALFIKQISRRDCCRAAGPETWWVYYPSASGGNQSPIDIVTEDAVVELDYCPGANPLQISYAPAGLAGTCSSTSANEAMVLINTGNTAQVNITDSKSCEWVAWLHVLFTLASSAKRPIAFLQSFMCMLVFVTTPSSKIVCSPKYLICVLLIWLTSQQLTLIFLYPLVKSTQQLNNANNSSPASLFVPCIQSVKLKLHLFDLLCIRCRLLWICCGFLYNKSATIHNK